MSYLEAFDTSVEEGELLATLLRHPRDAADILDMIGADEIVDPNISELWAIAARVAGQSRTPDTRALTREIVHHERRAVVEQALKDAMLAAGDGLDLAERVARIRAVRRREKIHRAGMRLCQLSATAAYDMDDLTEKALAELADADPTTDEPVHIAEAMGRFCDAQRSVPADRIVRTPWPELDSVLGGGLHRQRVYVVGALTGGGKSNVGLSMAGHAASNMVPSLVFSAEMSELEVTGRWFSRTAAVDLDSVTSYRLSRDASDRARELSSTGDPLWLVDRPNISAGAVYGIARRFNRRHDVRLVVVDYLQLLEAEDKRAARYEQVGAISRKLKLLARGLDTAVVVLAQLNRTPTTRPDGRPRKEDLRESGQIEQDSDAVILLHHKQEQVNGATIPTFEVDFIVDKNRHGRTRTITLEWAGEHATVR